MGKFFLIKDLRYLVQLFILMLHAHFRYCRNAYKLLKKVLSSTRCSTSRCSLSNLKKFIDNVKSEKLFLTGHKIMSGHFASCHGLSEVWNQCYAYLIILASNSMVIISLCRQGNSYTINWSISRSLFPWKESKTRGSSVYFCQMLPFHIHISKKALEIKDIFIKIAIFYFSIWIIKLYVFLKAGLSQEQKYTSVSLGLVLNFLLIFLIFIFLSFLFINYSIYFNIKTYIQICIKSN